MRGFVLRLKGPFYDVGTICLAVYVDQQDSLILHHVQDAMPHGPYGMGFNSVYVGNVFVI